MSEKGALLNAAASLVNAIVIAWQGDENRAVQREVLAAQKERLQYDRETQRKAAEARRGELRFQAESRLREIRATHETQRIFEYWPLRLLPSQYTDGLSTGVVPMKVLLAYDETLRPMAARLEEALREHFSAYFPISSPERPIDFLGGAWSGRELPGEASIRALHHAVGSVPTTILVVERLGGVIKIRVAYWGMNRRTYSYIGIGEVRYGTLLADVARRRALEWRDARERIRRIGNELVAIETDVHEHNLRVVEQEERLRGQGIDPVPLGFEDQYRSQPGFHDTIIEDLASALTLVGTAIADVHFLLHEDARPLLPTLFAHRPEPVIRTFLEMSANGFRSAYQSLIEQRPMWEPELLLDLARSLVTFRETATQHAHDSMRAWLRLREVDGISDHELVARIQPLVTGADRDYIESLFQLLSELGIADERLEIDWAVHATAQRPIQIRRDHSLPDPFAFAPEKRRRLRAAEEEENS